MKMKYLASALALATLTVGTTGVAQAVDVSSDKYVVKIGIADVEPKSDNGTVYTALGDFGVDISNSVRPSVTFEYLITPNIGVELLAAWPFSHDIELDHGVGKVGSVDLLPPTLSLQYHFLPGAVVSPFVGVGINYTFIYGEDSKGVLTGNQLDVDDAWGFAAHVGIDFNITENWLITADVRWIKLNADVSLNDTKIGSVDIDPWVWGLAVGYRF